MKDNVWFYKDFTCPPGYTKLAFQVDDEVYKKLEKRAIIKGVNVDQLMQVIWKEYIANNEP